MPPVSRSAILADIPELQNLIALSVRGLSVGYYTPQQIESSIKHIFGVDTQLIADSTYYVIENDNMIIACGGWSKRNTLYGGDQFKEHVDPLLDPKADAARIRAFFVHPAHARQGLGRMMINICESAAQQQGFTRFELGATLPGVPLYLAMGYTESELTNVPLADGELLQVIKMDKNLI